MRHLTFRLRNMPEHRLRLDGLNPESLAGRSRSEIERMSLPASEPAEVPVVTLADCFDVLAGDPTCIRFEGDLSGCDGLAAGWQSGQMVVDGQVGDFAAAGLRSGNVTINGSAGDYLASGMRGGSVTVSGSVGHFTAAARCGTHAKLERHTKTIDPERASGPPTPLALLANRGMRGGTIVIGGDCGSWLAARMRRGTVVVHGSVGPGCGARMIAGTLVLCGDFSDPLASGLRRGSILLLNHLRGKPPWQKQGHYPSATNRASELAHAISQVPALPSGTAASFTTPESTELTFLPILLRKLASLLPHDLPDLATARQSLRSVGDRAEGGLGEIIQVVA